jgi:single-stranded-DNA-specific exonuclease
MENYLKGLIKNNLKKFSLNPYIESIIAKRIFFQLIDLPASSLLTAPLGCSNLNNNLKSDNLSETALNSEDFITFLDKYVCNYINPSLKNLHDPFIMKDMDKAVKRIIKALVNNEKICLYGDYDVDGITSIAFLVLFLREIQNCLSNCESAYKKIIYKIPDRIKHGYGLGIEPINEIIALSSYPIENREHSEPLEKSACFNTDCASINDHPPSLSDISQSSPVSLIITVDLGITNFEEVKYAKSKNIDVIICDHHEVPEKIPEAEAILNPKQPDDIFPFKFLPGAGIAFNLAIALRKKMVEDGLIKTYPNLKDYLDIICLGIIADIVPIYDENRTLVYYGLKKINNNPRPGLKELRKICNLNFDNVNEYDIAWKIAPRINSTGRIGNPEIAVELLMTSTNENAKILAKKIEDSNKKRRVLESECFTDALNQANGCAAIKAAQCKIGERDERPQSYRLVTKPILVLSSYLWHPGVIGIAASRLAEHFKKPVLLLSGFKKDVLVGSARSYENIDIYAFLKNFNEFYIKFGGHKMACGLTLKKSELNKFLDSVKDMPLQNTALNLAGFKYMPQSDQERVQQQCAAAGASIYSLMPPPAAAHPLPLLHQFNNEVHLHLLSPEQQNTTNQLKNSDNAVHLSYYIEQPEKQADNGINGPNQTNNSNNYGYDEELSIDKIRKELMNELIAGLKLIAPFGPLNEQPRFLMKGVILDNLCEKETKGYNGITSEKATNAPVKLTHSYFTCNIISKNMISCKQNNNYFQQKAIIFKNAKLLTNKCLTNNNETNDIIFEFFNNYIKILNIIN